jgi:hypothetical protein
MSLLGCFCYFGGVFLGFWGYFGMLVWLWLFGVFFAGLKSVLIFVVVYCWFRVRVVWGLLILVLARTR